MKQFILNDGPDRNGQIRLAGDDYRYLVIVRRLAPGEYFPALLPGGDEVLVRVLSADKHTLVGEVCAGNTADAAVPNAAVILLFQALPRGDKMDIIVRQAAECGIAEIVPFVSEFSTAKINSFGPGKAGQKFVRWERIIREARQQSGSTVQTGIRQPVSFDGILTCWEQVKVKYPGALGLLFHHVPLEKASLHGYLGKDLRINRPVTGRSGAKRSATRGSADGKPVSEVVLVIGPEGGFSPTEAHRFVTAGFRPFTFAGAILRTETAALYATAAVQILLSERDSWEMK